MTNTQYPIGQLELVEHPTPEQFAEWLQTLEQLPSLYQAALTGATDTQLAQTYRTGSWTARQVVHHVCDSHMMGLFRIKQALTEENSFFHGYNRNLWTDGADYLLPVNISVVMLGQIHQKMLALLKHASTEDLNRTSEREGSGKQNLMQMAQLYAWHGLHHLEHIKLALAHNSLQHSE